MASDRRKLAGPSKSGISRYAAPTPAGSWASDPAPPGSPQRLARSLARRVQFLVSDLGVEDLDDVGHAIGAEPVGRGAQAAADGVERVRQVYQAALRLYPGDRVGHRQHVGNPLGQEQADDLARLGPDLLTEDHPHGSLPGGGRFHRGADLVVISDRDHVDPLGGSPFGQFTEREDRVP